jgi:hypothetical protein
MQLSSFKSDDKIQRLVTFVVDVIIGNFLHLFFGKAMPLHVPPTCKPTKSRTARARRGKLARKLLYTSMCHILVFSTAEMTALDEILLLSCVSFATVNWV